MNYDLVRPCAHCPFRTDVPPFLRRARAVEIRWSLTRGEFPCHETTGVRNDRRVPENEQQHCAGALIMLEHAGQSSQMMRISERLGAHEGQP